MKNSKLLLIAAVSTASIMLASCGTDSSADTATAGGVDVFLQGPKLHPAVLQTRELINQMPDGPAQPVESPHHEGVAGAQLIEQLVEFGTRA